MQPGITVPNSIRLLTGNKVTQWRVKKEIEEHGPEPEAPKGIPKPGAHIKGEARREWHRVTKEIESMGLITLPDRGALEAYCINYEIFKDASQERYKLTRIAKAKWKADKNANGLITHTDVYRKVVNTMTKANEQMMPFRKEFGLTALSRIRIRVQKILNKDPFTAFRDRRDNGKKETA
jgi:P27 family predicted phage terminase small subunit